MLINLLVPGALLRKLLLKIIIRTRNGVLQVIPRIPTDFSCFSWWRGSFSLIHAGSASLPT